MQTTLSAISKATMAFASSSVLQTANGSVHLRTFKAEIAAGRLRSNSACRVHPRRCGPNPCCMLSHAMSCSSTVKHFWGCGDKHYAFCKHNLQAPLLTMQDLLPLLRGELRHHQLQGVRWLMSLYMSGLNGILADELESDRRVSTVPMTNLSLLRS